MTTAPIGFTAIGDISGEDEEDGALLRDMAVAARTYLTDHKWCPPISAMYLADGVGGIVALFLVEFTTEIGGTDNRLWVVNGDLPDAYLVVEPHDTACEVLERYCVLMEEWIAEVLVSGDFENVFPVAAPRTLENADLLRQRMIFLRREIIPQFQSVAITS